MQTRGATANKMALRLLQLVIALPFLSLFGQALPVDWSQSYCTFDIGEVLKVNESAIGFAIDNYCIYCSHAETLSYDERRFDIWARIGVFKKYEIELKYSYPTAGLVSIKYQFLQGYLSGAFKSGFGYMKGTRQGYITDYVYDFYPTIIFTKGIAGNLKFFYAPKIIYSIHTRDRQEHTDRPPEYIFQYGHCLGLVFGKKFMFLPEVNWLWGNNMGTRYMVNQFGIGVNSRL